MNVKELNQDQLNELKFTYFYSDYYDEKIVNDAGLPILFSADIPNWIIYALYDGVDFVMDDFSCTAGMDENDFIYGADSLEDIKICLNCKKEYCTNCLKYKNGV
jgi:hypothetical protein